MSNLSRRMVAGKAAWNVAKAALVGSAILGLASEAEAATPHLAEALGALRSARESLTKARSDKAGHNLKAIKLIDQAIDEVRQGISNGQ